MKRPGRVPASLPSTPVTLHTLSQELLIGLEQRSQTQQIDGTTLPTLTSATIDALLEFACYVDACFRSSDSVSLSFLQELGRAYPILASISRDLRRRASDTARAGQAVFEPHDFEWYFLTPPLPASGEDDANATEGTSAAELITIYFYQRYKQAMVRHGFSSEIAAAISATLKEMCDNVFQHSGEHETTPAPGLAAYHVGDGWSVYSVADTGRGALASLLTNPAWAHLIDESEALRAVATKRASRRTTWVEGGGFGAVFKALADFNGVLRLRSGNAALTITGTEEAREGVLKEVPPLPGFLLTVRCRLSPDVPEYALLWDSAA